MYLVSSARRRTRRPVMIDPSGSPYHHVAGGHLRVVRGEDCN